MKMAICKSICIATFSNFFSHFYRSSNEVGQGNVFTRVCLFNGGSASRGSLPLRGEGVCLWEGEKGSTSGGECL